MLSAVGSWPPTLKADLILRFRIRALNTIDRLGESINRLANVLCSDARFIHLVNFANHRSKLDPFGQMYTSEPQQYFERYGRKINPLRAPDILKLIRAEGLSTALIPYYTFENIYGEKSSRIGPGGADQRPVETRCHRGTLVWTTGRNHQRRPGVRCRWPLWDRP